LYSSNLLNLCHSAHQQYHHHTHPPSPTDLEVPEKKTQVIIHHSFIDLDELPFSSQLEHVRKLDSATSDLSETEHSDDQIDDKPVMACSPLSKID